MACDERPLSAAQKVAKTSVRKVRNVDDYAEFVERRGDFSAPLFESARLARREVGRAILENQIWEGKSVLFVPHERSHPHAAGVHPAHVIRRADKTHIFGGEHAAHLPLRPRPFKVGKVQNGGAYIVGGCHLRVEIFYVGIKRPRVVSAGEYGKALHGATCRGQPFKVGLQAVFFKPAALRCGDGQRVAVHIGIRGQPAHARPAAIFAAASGYLRHTALKSALTGLGGFTQTTTILFIRTPCL